MSLLDELYQETILDYYQHPVNKGTLPDADVHNRGHNPLCGDDVEIFLKMDADRIQALRFNGEGCSISLASASMMSEALEGKDLDTANRAIAAFKKMMLENGESIANLGEEYEELEALEGVKNYPVRIKCATLAWNTLLEGINQVKNDKMRGTNGE